jgi:hypothetical protein
MTMFGGPGPPFTGDELVDPWEVGPDAVLVILGWAFPPVHADASSTNAAIRVNLLTAALQRRRAWDA